MAANDAFFRESKKAQSALKHSILRKYLATFAGATGTNSPGHRVGFLDGYAGPGEYANGTEGSPRIALTIAANQLAQNRHLECVFVERNPESFEALRRVVSASSTPAVALRGDVAKHLVPALKTFQDLPVIVFLDPFGAALERELTIDAVLNRGGTQPTELLLNFSLQTVRRAGARIHEKEGTTGRQATLDTMDRWLGGDWWRSLFLAPELVGHPDASDIAANQVAKEYAQQVTTSTSCRVFGVAMRRQAGHKAIFNLMLFHPRALAAFKYNEAVSLAQEDWRATMWGMDIAQAELEDDEDPQMGMSRADEMRDAFKADKTQARLDAISTIRDTISQTLSKQASVSVEKEFSKVFGAAAGEGRSLHLRAAWKELGDRGLVEPAARGDLDKAVIRRIPTPAGLSFR